MLLRGLDGSGQLGHVAGPVGVDAVQGAGPDQGFQHPPVSLAQVDASAEVVQVAVGAVAAAFFQEVLDGRFAHALDGPETVLNGAVVPGSEAELGPVDVGRQD